MTPTSRQSPPPIEVWKGWRHITKLDPDKPNPETLVKEVVTSGTDAIMISGTQGITKEKVDHLIRSLKGCHLPLILEPSHKDVVTFEVDYVFIPLVLNAGKKWWVIDAHYDWLKHCITRNMAPVWERLASEAYIVLNQESAVARVTESKTDLTEEEVIAYAMFADQLLRCPIIYIEYSGVYGDPNLVRAVKNNLKNATLFYGGGIDSRERALEMGGYATIIVGNIVYKDIEKYHQTIV